MDNGFKLAFFGNEEDAKKLNKKLQVIKSKIDDVTTPQLAKIKRVLNYMNFAYIKDQEQLELNQANVVLPIKNCSNTAYGCDVTYYVENKKTALVYAQVKPTYKAGEITGFKVKYQTENNYSVFIADVLNNDIIFSEEFDSFVKVNKEDQTFEVIDDAYFKKNYPTITKQTSIRNFLPVFEELYRNHIKTPHCFDIKRYSFYTNDFIYDVKSLSKELRKPNENELFFAYYDVSIDEINTDLVYEFEEEIAKDKDTLHNLKLMHAYAMRRKLEIEPPEKFFIFKDEGRTGKGLFIKSFSTLLSVEKLSLDTLLSQSVFDRNNEMVRARWCDVVHINEAKEITEKDMRVLRPIATNENFTARSIGADSYTFKPHCIMIIDTNDTPSTGTMKANASRTVNLALKDRAKTETDEERHAFFKKYWEYIAPDSEHATLSSALAFLIVSLEYLKAQDGKFAFKEVKFSRNIKNEAFDFIYKTLDEMQKDPYDKTPFILASDPTAKELLERCYGNTQDEIERKKSDFESQGIALSHLRKIDGKTCRVHEIVDINAFNDWFN